jgi:ribosomal-protein-alanine N-acetyltransferase
MLVLETEHLLLRQFHQGDLKDLLAWGGNHSVECGEVQAQRFLNFCFREYFVWGIGPWGMLLKTTGGMVGNCGFCHINFEYKEGEVNVYVAPQYRGNGLAPEALSAVLKFGFEEIGLARIQARCAPDNTSSERVMQKVGMTFERTIPSHGSSKDGSCRDRLYAVTRSDLKLRPLE